MARTSTYINFPRNTEEAFNFYKSVFGGEFIGGVARFSDIPHSERMPPLAEAEIDYYWDKLSESGEEDQCGWLKDEYGVSWQIVPTILPKLITDPTRAGRVTKAFLQMKKFDIEKIKLA